MLDVEKEGNVFIVRKNMVARAELGSFHEFKQLQKGRKILFLFFLFPQLTDRSPCITPFDPLPSYLHLCPLNRFRRRYSKKLPHVLPPKGTCLLMSHRQWKSFSTF